MEYRLFRSARKTLAVKITADGNVFVYAPIGASMNRIEGFIKDKSAWIEKHRTEICRNNTEPKFTKAEIVGFKKDLIKILTEKLPSLAETVGVTYGRVTVKSQKTVWGSCSVKGNLSFNCLLFLIPENLAEYVIIHELCHLKFMNHSERFWAEVRRYYPDYKNARKNLKLYGRSLFYRL